MGSDFQFSLALARKAARPRRLVAIDPGSPDLGVAVFEDGVLVLCEWVRVQRLAAPVCPPCERKLRDKCRHMVDPLVMVQICDEVEQLLGTPDLEAGAPGMPDVVVFEEPIKWGGTPGTGATTIGKLGRVVAALGDRAAAWGARVYFYWPSEWKGNGNKQVHQTLALCCLSEEERKLIPRICEGEENWRYRSDPTDAAALGRWWLEQAGARPSRQLAAPSDLRRRVEEKR